ncbi:Ldh family oxidoreductase, partial [Escherichia coli]
EGFIVGGPVGDFELLLCHGTVCVVGKIRDLILQLSKSSIYSTKPHAGRNLGQLHIVINPNFFSSSELFRQHLSQTMRELNAITPAPGFNQVYYPGQDQDIKQRKAAVEGIEIVDDIYQYLISDALYNTSYETKNPFAQ